MLIHLVVGTEVGLRGADELVSEGFGLLEGTPCNLLPILQDPTPDNFVYPFLGDVELPERVCQLITVLPGGEVGGGALEHGDVRRLVRHRRHHRSRRGPGANDQHALARVVVVFLPFLGVHDVALEGLHARPFGGVALAMAVIALAHPEEAPGKGLQATVDAVSHFEGPKGAVAIPVRRFHPVVVADMGRKVVLFDDLPHVLPDGLRRGNGLPGPGLEAIAEGIEIAVGADARVLMGEPGAAEAALRFQHDKALIGALLLKMDRAADARNAGADNENVEVFCVRGRARELICCRHEGSSTTNSSSLR